MRRRYYVYILTNRSDTLYIGVTNDLGRRLYEHKHRLLPGFASKYNIDRLVYCEAFDRPRDAIEREKQLKRWRRAKKIALIRSANPRWLDLSGQWIREPESPSDQEGL